MSEESEALSTVFTAKLIETFGDLADREFDSLAMVEALASAFLSLAASCAPNRAEYERVTDEIARVRWEIWDRAHPN